MRLVKARVQNYRSIIDSGEFQIEQLKTIMVGPNEAGKTVLLKALQQLNKPDDVRGFDILRDYPRSKFNDFTTQNIDPEKVTVVTGYFALEDEDKALIPEEFHQCKYKLYRNLNNKAFHSLLDAPEQVLFKDIKNKFIRMFFHMDSQYKPDETDNDFSRPGDTFKSITKDWDDVYKLTDEDSLKLQNWLDDNYQYVEENNEKEEQRHAELLKEIKFSAKGGEVLKVLSARLPVFILFNNYFKVKPIIHLEHLARRVEQKILDDDYFDYGNLCLLKLLGFSARELSDLGNTPAPDMNDAEALKTYRDKLDTRSYQLNAGSVRLTNQVRSVWMPDQDRHEADKLKVIADGQYLKVVVEDDLSVDIELDQRSEGFQWLVSFFVVFFSEAMDKHNNAVLLLDEPGTSLHALKQRNFKSTISKLAQNNQTIFTTHSPFLIGADELDIVRVVEMNDRSVGTRVHTSLTSKDPAGLLPLQEAVGYDLANSLFSQQRNFILEQITDYWYFESTVELLREANITRLNDDISLVFASAAGKVVYYATILHAHKLKVAALLDTDAASDQASQQEILVNTVGNNKIIRSKDFCKNITQARIEDLLRATLIKLVVEEYAVDVTEDAAQQPDRPIVELFLEKVPGFSKYNLSKKYIRWTSNHHASDLSDNEQAQWNELINSVNAALE